MAMDNRPLSPHLQIYRWSLTMFLSILHRATGAGLAFGGILLTLWLFAGMGGENSFAVFHAFARSLTGQTMLFCWLFAFVFHLLNGMRHLVWDSGIGINVTSARQSGQVVLVAAFVFTAIFWFLAR